MLLERQTVSRKTPGDGKLEISPEAAARLGEIGEEFPLTSGGREGRARLVAMECTCGRGGAAGHVHHFVESPLFRELVPAMEVRVELDENAPGLRVEPDRR